jgi:hypothetical protein
MYLSKIRLPHSAEGCCVLVEAELQECEVKSVERQAGEYELAINASGRNRVFIQDNVCCVLDYQMNCVICPMPTRNIERQMAMTTVKLVHLHNWHRPQVPISSPADAGANMSGEAPIAAIQGRLNALSQLSLGVRTAMASKIVPKMAALRYPIKYRSASVAAMTNAAPVKAKLKTNSGAGGNKLNGIPSIR